MKEDAISKINKMGRIATIITVIAKICVIMALIGVFAATVAAAFIPKDFLAINNENRYLIDISFSSFGKTLTDEEVLQGRQEVEKMLEEETAASSTTYCIDAIDINNDGIYIDFTTAGDNIYFNLHNLVWVLLFVFFYLAMTLVTLFFIEFLFKAFQNCKSPFEQNVIKKMKNLAYSLIPWAVLSTVRGSVIRSFFTKSIQFNGIGIDLKIVMTVLIILALAYIFQYGAVLQQESDETL